MAINTLSLNGARLEEGVFLPATAGSTVTFATGDMLTWSASNGYVSPVSSFTWATSDAATRRQIRQTFCGIAGEAQFSDSPARLVRVYTNAEIDITCASSTAWAVGDLAGPAGDGASVMYSQKIANVTNKVEESIGRTVRVYASDSKTIAKVQLQGVSIGAFALRAGDARILTIPDGVAWAASTVLAATAAYKLFGGPAELLALGATDATAVTTQAITGTIAKNGVSLSTTLTVATAASGRGVYTEQALTSETGRTFGSEDTFTLTEGGVATPSGTIAYWTVKYRPLY